MPKVMSWLRMLRRYCDLVRRAAGEVGAARAQLQVDVDRLAVDARRRLAHRLEDRELDLLGADRPRGAAVELLQEDDRALGAPLRALDLERLVAALDLDVERRLDRAQMLVEVAGEVGEARVVGRDEGVAKDHGSDVAAGDGLSREAASIIAP
jgi:hypothetical protein